MSANPPTTGQLERSLAQSIRRLYRTQLGHNPSRVICQLTGKHLTICIEGSVTTVEKLLIADNQSQVAAQVRTDLESAFLPRLQALIEDQLGVGVVDLVSSSMKNTNSTGLFAVLDQCPSMRMAPQAS